MRTTCYRLNDAEAKCYRPNEHWADEIPLLFNSSATLILKLAYQRNTDPYGQESTILVNI
jgi:hypothetical protein